MGLLLAALVGFVQPSSEVASGCNFPEVVYPADNQPTAARIELGRRLFFDPILSETHTVSCASCHDPVHAFSDTVALSPGVHNRPGKQNAPTLTNVALLPYLTRAGGVPTLEMQVLVPVQEHNELNLNILEIADRLCADSAYHAMSLEAYGRVPDAFVITRALACFERTLISDQSAFDRYQRGDQRALSASAIRGMELFMGDRANCGVCHGGALFSDHSFRNNGLYEAYADSGRFRLTMDESDRDMFRVPTLRNVGFTAPYMHDGSMATLEQVIDHYSENMAAHPRRDSVLHPLYLNPEEKQDLLAFLLALNDSAFTQNSSHLSIQLQ